MQHVCEIYRVGHCEQNSEALPCTVSYGEMGDTLSYVNYLHFI